MGIIKDATETTSRVELHTSCQTISVDRRNIQVVGEGAKVMLLMFLKPFILFILPFIIMY